MLTFTGIESASCWPVTEFHKAFWECELRAPGQRAGERVGGREVRLVGFVVAKAGEGGPRVTLDMSIEPGVCTVEFDKGPLVKCNGLPAPLRQGGPV